MPLEVRQLPLDGVLEVRPTRIIDERGFFSEVWNRDEWGKAGIKIDFVQDNYSFSEAMGVIRGLHYQLPPFDQDKLVCVTRGRVFDVVVDVRRTSPTFGQWTGIELSREKWNQLLVPKGFAHGFLTLETNCEVQYKVSAPYSRDHERAIRFDDPAIAIAWPDAGTTLQLSAKDAIAPLLAETETFD